MIELMEVEIDNVLAFRLEGKVSEDDMKLLLGEAKKKIEQHGNIVLLEQIDSIKGISIKAIIAEVKYLFSMGLTNISKVAVLTDKQWIQKVVSLESKFFRKIQIQGFSLDEKAAALNFLREV